MQFNYQNARIEEENHSDFRRYGLLNKNLVDDEQELDNYLYKSKLSRVRHIIIIRVRVERLKIP